MLKTDQVKVLIIPKSKTILKFLYINLINNNNLLFKCLLNRIQTFLFKFMIFNRVQIYSHNILLIYLFYHYELLKNPNIRCLNLIKHKTFNFLSTVLRKPCNYI
jgi:hypothetical protein